MFEFITHLAIQLFQEITRVKLAINSKGWHGNFEHHKKLIYLKFSNIFMISERKQVGYA